jgi:glycosyltransferase involved in cell wall biosynthesis
VSADLVVASFPPPVDRNPYQRLLYEHLAHEGVALDPVPRFRLGWLWDNRSRVRVLHFHWPELYYRFDSSSRLARAVLSWVRFGLFVARLQAARLFGYRVVWTIHQITPHESVHAALDRLAARFLASLSAALIVHDEGTAAAVDRELDGHAKTHVIPHGSYVGVYPSGRPSAEVRQALGIPDDSFVALSFGQLRRYKNIGLLVEGFERAALDGAVLLVAGFPVDEDESRRVRHAAREKRFLVLLLEYVPDEQVAELYGASDVAVSTRGDGGTSGALVLALSLGVPVVAARARAYVELTDEGRAGWHFSPGDPDSLAAALRAASQEAVLEQKARHARERARRLEWPEIAAETATLLRSV